MCALGMAGAGESDTLLSCYYCYYCLCHGACVEPRRGDLVDWGRLLLCLSKNLSLVCHQTQLRLLQRRQSSGDAACVTQEKGVQRE
mmetsp:Transcript_81485/g.119374  ORF Transcript_81485/g.119374 Transcript_81485/m.119374 type:complete len:86 (-) Transcript_81485:1058-1315(-)